MYSEKDQFGGHTIFSEIDKQAPHEKYENLTGKL